MQVGGVHPNAQVGQLDGYEQIGDAMTAAINVSVVRGWA